jgi:L-amino acid N-acyltransferase YncA
MPVRPASPGDGAAIAAIFNEGISERVATFETRPKGPAEVEALIESGAILLVAERDGEVVGFAKVGPYDDPSRYYDGVGEATLYVTGTARRSGLGRELLEALAAEAVRRGCWKLVGKIFTQNEPSIALVHACGWRDVGVHLRHGQLDGEWKDVLVVEKLLGKAQDEPMKAG